MKHIFEFRLEDEKEAALFFMKQTMRLLDSEYNPVLRRDSQKNLPAALEALVYSASVPQRERHQIVRQLCGDNFLFLGETPAAAHSALAFNIEPQLTGLCLLIRIRELSTLAWPTGRDIAIRLARPKMPGVEALGLQLIAKLEEYPHCKAPGCYMNEGYSGGLTDGACMFHWPRYRPRQEEEAL